MENDRLETLRRFVELHERYERIQEAEDRAFVRYMDGTGSAGTARKARSRTNEISADYAALQGTVYRIMDADENYDSAEGAIEYARRVVGASV